MSTAAIAEKLCLSVNTVETYHKNLFHKFGVTNMVQLVKKAMQSGITL